MVFYRKRLNTFIYKYNSDLMVKKEGYTTKETEEIANKLEKDGWKVKTNMLNAVKKDDSVWWYEFGGEKILSASKGRKTVSIGVYGDIAIRGNERTKNEDEYFVCKQGGNEDGELTEDLVKNGTWDENNWFEIIVEDSKTKEFTTVDVPISLQDAVKIFFDTIKKIDNGKEEEIQKWF